MHLVRLSDENLKDFLKVIPRVFVSESDRDDAEGIYRACLDRDHPECTHIDYFLAYSGKNPVGLTGYYELHDAPKEFWLGWFGVVPESRRKGIGSEILDETVKRVSKLGGKRVRIWTMTKTAEKFYRKNGFRKGRKLKWETFQGKKIGKYPSQAEFYRKDLK